MYDVKESLTRQSDLISGDALKTPITVVGAGAVGSWVVLSLAKMGFSNIEVFDNDTVDVVNLASQFYPHRAIGKKKVDALSEMVEEFTGFGVTTHDALFDEQFTRGIIIASVDSMAARKKIYRTAQANACRTLIDPRMGAEAMAMYVIDTTSDKDRTSYEKTLYSDSDAMHERCTAKATIYCANVLAGMVVNAVKNVTCNQRHNRLMTFDLAEHGYQAWQKEAV